MFFKDKLKLVKLPVSRILPNPAQPRKDFDQAALESLAQSIKENGLLQPVTVRRENGGYTLIAGERRLRACKLAGLKEIPAIVTECAPEDSAVLALLENLQRKDLQTFEQANALVNLLREWHITQEEAAKRLGISQSYLANKLRLLKLSPEEQSEILEYKLTERHARALLRVDDGQPAAEAVAPGGGEGPHRGPDRGAGHGSHPAQTHPGQAQAHLCGEGHPPVYQHHRPRRGRHENRGHPGQGGEKGDRGVYRVHGAHPQKPQSTSLTHSLIHFHRRGGEAKASLPFPFYVNQIGKPTAGRGNSPPPLGEVVCHRKAERASALFPAHSLRQARPCFT